MAKRVANLCLLDCVVNGDKTDVFTKLIETTFKQYGGHGNISPYLFNMTNGDVRKNFVAGGIVTKDVSVLLDYSPSNNLLKIKVISDNTISDKEIMGFITSRFPECTNYQVV